MRRLETLFNRNLLLDSVESFPDSNAAGGNGTDAKRGPIASAGAGPVLGEWAVTGLAPELAALVEDYWVDDERTLVPLALDLARAGRGPECLALRERYLLRMALHGADEFYCYLAGRMALYFGYYELFESCAAIASRLRDVAGQSRLIDERILRMTPTDRVAIIMQRHYDSNGFASEAQSRFAMDQDAVDNLLSGMDEFFLLEQHPHIYCRLAGVAKRDRVLDFLQRAMTALPRSKLDEGNHLRRGLHILWLAQHFAVPVHLCRPHKMVYLDQSSCALCEEQQQPQCARIGCKRSVGTGHRFYGQKKFCSECDYERWYRQHGQYSSGIGPN